MRYRILINGVGKHKVQSSPMLHSGSIWNWFKPLAWHERGHGPSTNCHSLNWGGDEFELLTQARDFLTECREYDIQAAKERSWLLVEAS